MSFSAGSRGLSGVHRLASAVPDRDESIDHPEQNGQRSHETN